MTVSYMVTVDATVTIVDVTPNGNEQVIVQDSRVQGGMWYSLSGKVVPPVGKEVVRLEALTDEGEELIAECEFTVTG